MLEKTATYVPDVHEEGGGGGAPATPDLPLQTSKRSAGEYVKNKEFWGVLLVYWAIAVVVALAIA